MQDQRIMLEILDRLRKAGDTKTPLSKLLEARFEGKIPHHTGGGVFGHCIGQLTESAFIKLYDAQGNEFSDTVLAIGRKDSGTHWSLGRGYGVASFLMGKEDEVHASLTDKLADVQSVLGVSLSGLLEAFDSAWMRVRPIFGAPSGFPWADVFVLMPFHEDFSPVFDDHIQKVCASLKLTCKRADNIFGSSNIIDDVWELIANSKTIIADCTNRNPNVFYELGIAHALGKQVIIITQSSDDIPFDIRHIRFIKYEYTPRGMKAFESKVKKFILESRDKDA